jgi:predicted nuclease with TOPRIM domain
MDLERQTGKTYGEIVKDFGEKTRQVEDLEEKAKSVQREIQELRDMKAKLEGEIREFKKRRSAVLQGLNRIIAIEE